MIAKTKTCCLDTYRCRSITFMYKDLEKPTEEIGKSYGISARQVQRILQRHGEIRDRSESFRIAIKQGRMTYEHLRKDARKPRKAINPGLRFKILNRDKHTCQSCGGKAPNVKLQIDHRNNTPTDNRENNLWALCTECNYGKKAKFKYKELT